MDLGIAGRVALVGASSKGLGYACAEALAREGARVVMCARGEADLRAAAARIAPQAATPPLAVPADLMREPDIERLVTATEAHFGPPDILVTNIGGPPPGPWAEHDDAAYLAACERLLLHPLRLIRRCLPAMRERRWGRIVNITSMAVKEPMPNLVLSGIFRAGLVSLAKAIAAEVAPEGITVNNVAPGYFETDRAVQLLQDQSQRTGRPLSELRQEAVAAMPMRRYPQPAELGSVVAFLCSERASVVSGVTLPLDGGGAHGLF